MKLKKQFTLVELLAVIAIIGIMATALTAVISGALARANAAACQANLRDLGNGMIAYKTENNYYPCGIKDTDSQSARERKIERPRSTVATLQAYRETDGQELELTRFFCPESGKMVPKKHTYKLKKENVGYHYTDGNVRGRVLKSNMALMRDLNEGHVDAEYGMILLGSGGVKKIESVGKEKSPGNYSKYNWYKNKDVFINCDHFKKSYAKRVNFERPDDVD